MFQKELAGNRIHLAVFRFDFRYFSFRFGNRNQVERLEVYFLMNIINGQNAVVQ